MKYWHIVISGFLQDEGKLTGMVVLWHKLHIRCNNSDTRVELRSWNDNWSALAECIWRLKNTNTKIGIYAYSWGCGWGAMRLANELRKRGMSINHMVLSDPVYRHSYPLGNWRALVPWSKIKVPGNVFDVHSFAQDLNIPRAHKLVAKSELTTIRTPIQVSATHQYMDDYPEFHKLSLKLAKNLHEPNN